MSNLLWPRGTLRVEHGAILPAPGKVRSPSGSTRIYLLVHGFNNDRIQARTSYRDFRERISDIIGLNLAGRIWEFYWPGYENLIAEPLRRYSVPRIANSAYTAVSYFRQVPKAVSIGRLLGDYLLRLRASTRPTEVVLIGHSLGCRLILEALSEMAPRARSSQVPAVFLMAAAVPVQHLQPSAPLRAAAELPRHRIALYSARDTVLRWTFPAGQLLAADGGLRPRALGLEGQPRDCWTGRDQTMLRHGDYWSDSTTTPNVVRLFGKSTPHVLNYSGIVPRPLPESGPLRDWQIPERPIGA